MLVTIDIGGEGRHLDAWNINPSRLVTLGPHRGNPIPRLICARAAALPFADRSVASILVERTPLRAAALAEMARVLMPGGEVVLRHVPLPHKDRHAAAKALFIGTTEQRTVRIGRQVVQETRIRTSPQR